MRFETVIFDCDSTLSAIEGIDELAREHREEISRLTRLAMSGAVSLEEVYGRRLGLIQPSRAEVERLGELYVQRIVPGASEAVQALHREGVVVQVLSGGLALPVRRVAAHLGIGPARVAAVEVWFDSAGRFAGYDQESPLTRSGGKRRWLEAHGRTLPGPILLVGDGMTDLEARPLVDAFAAFTGVVDRPGVASRADYVLPGPSLHEVERLALGTE